MALPVAGRQRSTFAQETKFAPKMINQFTGRIDFNEGPSLIPFEVLDLSSATRTARPPSFVRTGPIYSLGTFASSFGAFSVAVRLTHEQRIRTVLLSCLENVTSSQTVWRTILDAIIEQDLESMTTFVWGRVALKRDEFSDLDQMVVGYTNDPGVVRPDDETSPSLQARKLSPKSLGAGDSHLKDLLRKSRNPKPNEKQ